MSDFSDSLFLDDVLNDDVIELVKDTDKGDNAQWWHECHYHQTLETMANLCLTYGIDETLKQLSILIHRKLNDASSNS